MEHKLSHLNTAKEITLSQEERSYLRAHMAHVVATPVGIAEPLFQRGVQHGLRIALSSFLFVIFVGGSISAVASNALPGDPLYPVKIGFNKNIKAALLRTPEEKVAFHKGQVEERISEIKTLAETKTLTSEKQKKAQEALDKNVQELSDELTILSDKSPSTALSVTTNLEENLKANKEVLESTLSTNLKAKSAATLAAEDTNDDNMSEHEVATSEALKTIDGTLQKVSQQEVKILSKEIDHITNEANTTDTNTTDDGTKTDQGKDEKDNQKEDDSTIPPITPVEP